MHPAPKIQIALLQVKEVIVPAKYSNFSNIFSKKLAEIFLKQTVINEHIIELI